MKRTTILEADEGRLKYGPVPMNIETAYPSGTRQTAGVTDAPMGVSTPANPLAPSPASVPARMAIIDPATNRTVSAQGLSNASTVNENLARVNPRAAMWRMRQLERADAALGGSALKSQYLRNVMLRNEAALGVGPQLPGMRPGEIDNPSYVHIRNPVGEAMDTDMAANYDAYDPGVRAAMAEGMQEVNRDMSRLLASPDKGQWGNVEDFEKAVNALESVKKWGGLLPGYISDIARRSVSPNMKAQFDANDATVKSFHDWYKQRGYDQQPQEGGPANRDPYEVWTGNDPGAQAIKQSFYSDAGAAKYKAVGDRIQQVQVTPDQRMDLQFRAESEVSRRRREAFERAKAANPEAYANKFFDDVTGTVQEMPKKEKTGPDLPTAQTWAAAFNAENEKLGIPERVRVYQDMDGTVKSERYKVASEDAMTDQQLELRRADQMASQGVTIYAVPNLKYEGGYEPVVPEAGREAQFQKYRRWEDVRPKTPPPIIRTPITAGGAQSAERKMVMLADAQAAIADPNTTPEDRIAAQEIMRRLGQAR